MKDAIKVLMWLAFRLYTLEEWRVLNMLCDGTEGSTQCLPSQVRVQHMADRGSEPATGYLYSYVREKYPHMEQVAYDFLLKVGKDLESFTQHYLGYKQQPGDVDRAHLMMVVHSFCEEVLPELSILLRNKLNMNRFSLEPDRILARSEGASLPSTAAGSALFGEVSLINHSCLPNAIWYVSGGNIHILACKDIAQGEEVTIDYGYGDLVSVEVRRQNLNKRYHFWCHCPRCQHDMAQPLWLQHTAMEMDRLTDTYWPYNVSTLGSEVAVAASMSLSDQLTYQGYVGGLWSQFWRNTEEYEAPVRTLLSAAMIRSVVLLSAVMFQLSSQANVLLLHSAVLGAQAACPGSNYHLYLSMALYVHSSKVDDQGSSKRMAWWAVEEAFLTRYGPRYARDLRDLISMALRLYFGYYEEVLCLDGGDARGVTATRDIHVKANGY